MQVGDILGSYQLERLLGEGSMGQVFQARHVRLGRQVALKVLRSSYAHDGNFVRRFFQEAHAVNQINHEHIVEIFDFVEDSAAGHVYCVMELLRGQSLSDLLREDRLSLTRIRRIMVQVCAALSAAHQLGVVHRDVKPDNLFITQKSGQTDFVKVLDFGVAKLLTAEGVNGTLDGTIIGTPTYMSPEQAAGLPVDARADIYAVGTVLYELLTGTPPFVAPNFGQLMVKILTESPPELPTHTPAGDAIPPELARITLRCLSKEPEERPAQLAEVITALLTDSDSATLAVVPPEERPTRPMPMPFALRFLPRHAGWMAMAGALAMVGVGLVLMRGGEPAVAPPAAVVAEPRVAEAPKPQPVPVSLTVNSVPAGARVVRADTGETLGVTPWVAQMPPSDGSLGVRVELAGYVPSEHQLRLDASSTLEVPLVRAGTKPARATPSRSSLPRSSLSRKSSMGNRDAVIDPFAP
ncbi:serine/threonine protein kinase [Cystobacter ferrugineus]|uniref:serine/threonine protein kinase n=1 Tax=Cystobacter ferrugineus TaxID=83449 RepID=UPI0009FFB660|nr:serine/threonine-protein kinase [Cystobacter ferrugineus]